MVVRRNPSGKPFPRSRREPAGGEDHPKDRKDKVKEEVKIMARKTIDCRDYPGVNCTVSIAADTEEELVAAVVEHGTRVHGYEDTAEFRAQILKDMKTV